MNTDIQILRALRQAGPEGVSGAALAKHLGVSRAAVWNRI
ncbi:MAG: HTH domain-containing protein [Verrucomicrobiota bacterium]